MPIEQKETEKLATSDDSGASMILDLARVTAEVPEKTEDPKPRETDRSLGGKDHAPNGGTKESPPARVRVSMLRDWPEEYDELFDLQGSYGFPWDKRRYLPKMTLAAGRAWLPEAKAIKIANLKEIDEKHQKRVEDAVARAMEPVLEMLEKRMTAQADAIEALAKSQNKANAEVVKKSVSSDQQDAESDDEVEPKEVSLPMLPIVVAIIVVAAICWKFL